MPAGKVGRFLAAPCASPPIDSFKKTSVYIIILKCISMNNKSKIVIHTRIWTRYGLIITVPLCMLSPLGIAKSTILKLFEEELGA